MQYYSLQHLALLPSPVTSTAGYCFCFGSIPSGVISPLISSSNLGTYRHGEFFQYPIILPFHTVHGLLKARILKWFAIPFSSGPHSVRSLHHDHLSWVAPRAWLSFIELDKSVVHVIRLTSFLWLWFQCFRPLTPSRNTYHLIGVSLTLDEGYLLIAAPPDLEHGVAPLGPLVPAQPPLLGRGVYQTTRPLTV